MKLFRVALALFAILVSVLPLEARAVGPVVGSSCRFEWTEPQTNTDATALVDLAEYRFYITQTPGVYSATPAKVSPAPTPDPVAGSILTTPCPAGIPQGQNYAVVTAVDLAGNESAKSNEAPFVFDTRVPGAPINLTPTK